MSVRACVCVCVHANRTETLAANDNTDLNCLCTTRSQHRLLHLHRCRTAFGMIGRIRSVRSDQGSPVQSAHCVALYAIAPALFLSLSLLLFTQHQWKRTQAAAAHKIMSYVCRWLRARMECPCILCSFICLFAAFIFVFHRFSSAPLLFHVRYVFIHPCTLRASPSILKTPI